jgi:hypothetical protein
MIFFDNTVFKLNPDMVINTIPTPIANITVVDDFYLDYDSVTFELDKLPAAYTAFNRPGSSLDARKSYAQSMQGTILPYREEYTDVVRNIIGYNGRVRTEEALLVNCNQFYDDKWKDHYYNIHTDTSVHGADIISTVVMLNKKYSESEGFNTYSNEPSGTGLWTPKDEMKVNYTVQARPNRAIIFSPLINHGAALGGQFLDEMRYTQVIFSHLL